MAGHPWNYAGPSKVYILDLGYLECDANMMVAMSVVGTRQTPKPPTKWIKVPCYAVLIDHPDRKVLFDLGTHPDRIHPPEIVDLFPYHRNKNQTMEKQLALAGIGPNDVSAVVLSHLHFDHAGNFDLFQHADIYFHPVELKLNPGVLPGFSVKKPHFIERDTELLPGVEVITLPGHTAGILGIVIHLKESGLLIFPSDAIYGSGNYGPPARPSGTVYDSLSYYESIEKVRRLEAISGARVMFSHDMEFFETMKKAPGYYK